MHTKLVWKKIKNFVASTGGFAGIAFGLTALPMLMVMGAALDYAQAVSAKWELQRISDATAVSGARLPATANNNRLEAMQAMFEASVNQTPYLGVTKQIDATNAQVSVDVDYNSPTHIMKIFGVDHIPVKASTTARSQVQNGGVICLLALNPDAVEGLHLQGINKMSQHDCWAWVNSNSATAMNAVGASEGRAQGFCVNGSVVGGTHFAPPPYQGCDPYPDPFADQFARYSPDTTTCTARNLQLNSGSYVIYPGVYCGGLSLKPQAEVEMRPGTYIIKDGGLDVMAQSVLTGEGVTLYFTGNNTGINIRGGGSVVLRAPASGEMAGFLFVQDRYSNPGAEIEIQGGGRVKMEGALYTPTWRVSIGGNGEVNQEAKFWTMVADSFHMEGNGRLFIDSDAASIGIPNVMPKIPTGPLLLR